MFNKKFLLLCLVFLVCSFLVVGCGLPTPPKAITIDDLDMVNAYVVGDTFAGSDADNYWGPYNPGTGWSLTDGALVFDCSVGNAWCTMVFKNQEMAADAYKYAVFTMKVNNNNKAADAANATMTLGGVEGSGKPLGQWGIDDLSTSYKTYILDLKANGFTEWGPMYFAMNKSTAVDAVISIDKIVLANKK